MAVASAPANSFLGYECFIGSLACLDHAWDPVELGILA
ncbi:hypothetical protein ANMWB30_02770 [Arthrobacter sp. MWB30]|nr:hypothetical protein ANMWB30_02770 [Arthrobacter sp. MWB30]